MDIFDRELKQELKLEAEEEKPTFTKKDFKGVLKDEIREVIKEMLIEDNLIKKQPPQNIETPSSDPENSDPPPDPNSSGKSSLPNETKIRELNEWDEYERTQGISDYVENEWAHKTYMLGTKFVDKEIIKLHDLVLKELALSNLPDTEIAFIYAVKMDCIEEWLSMGFLDLAKQRLVHMLFRLKLMTSVEGLELIAQHGTSSIAMSMDRLQPSREGFPEDEGEEQKGKKKSIGIKKLVNKLRR